MTAKRAVVVGAGISGLSTAYALKQAKPDLDVVVVEARNRVGGNIVTERREGFLIDGGPDSFLRTKPQAVELCKELGIDGQLIAPREEARKVYLVHQGELELMPAGMALAVPTRVRPMLTTPLLSFPAKLRMLGDFVKSAPKEQPEDESVADFVGRRFGQQAAEKLASPLLGGIYAGDVSELSIMSTFPQLVDLERKYGSLIRGFLTMQLKRAHPEQNGGTPGMFQLLSGWLKEPTEAAPSPFQTLRGGVGTLITALTERLPRVKTGHGVTAITREGDLWRVVLEGGETIDADGVVLAAPAHAAARMVPDEKLAADLGGIPYLSTATVFFAFDERTVERGLDGSGFVAPKGEAKILAGTYVSSKWDDRAPKGSVLVRAFLGGARNEVDVKSASDDELAGVAKSELERLMGPLGKPLFSRVFRYVDSNPQPVVGHAARMARVHARLADMPGVVIAGAAYDGVGIPDCIRQGRTAAEKLAARL
ncbi:MAG: protoporphyrinogen oxidase [Myxococcales bacterium]|nr:protoporphyrinogen oxidase [Myxococcales bacterium]MCB9583397.1 protoporphyrinogen oxidase [Polyangiaceae bacterium]